MKNKHGQTPIQIAIQKGAEWAVVDHLSKISEEQERTAYLEEVAAKRRVKAELDDIRERELDDMRDQRDHSAGMAAQGDYFEWRRGDAITADVSNPPRAPRLEWEVRE